MRATSIIYRRELGAYLRSPFALGDRGAAAARSTASCSRATRCRASSSRRSSSSSTSTSRAASRCSAACCSSFRLISEERQTHSMVLLNTSPVRDSEIVLGKFFAALTFLAILLAAVDLHAAPHQGERQDHGLRRSSSATSACSCSARRRSRSACSRARSTKQPAGRRASRRRDASFVMVLLYLFAKQLDSPRARSAAGARPVVDPLPERLHARRPEPEGRHLLPRGHLLLPAARREDAGGEAMAMRTASPWWASLAFGVGLLFIFASASGCFAQEVCASR